MYYDIETFLNIGGTLLRQTINDQGEFVVEKLSIGKDWNVQLICESPESCEKIIDTLVAMNPTRFMATEKKSKLKNDQNSPFTITPTK
jgi:hypothetical protein